MTWWLGWENRIQYLRRRQIYHQTQDLRPEKKAESKVLNAVETPVSDHPKCEDLVFANGRWSLTRKKPQGPVFSEKMSEHIYFMELGY